MRKTKQELIEQLDTKKWELIQKLRVTIDNPEHLKLNMQLNEELALIIELIDALEEN